MHPLSIKSTAASLDLYVLVMLKPKRNVIRLPTVDNMGEERA